MCYAGGLNSANPFYRNDVAIGFLDLSGLDCPDLWRFMIPVADGSDYQSRKA